jgi:hypothetical protein
LGFELRAPYYKAGALSLEPHLQSIFALVILEKGVSQTFCPSRPQTTILQIATSLVVGLQV